MREADSGFDLEAFSLWHPIFVAHIATCAISLHQLTVSVIDKHCGVIYDV